MLSESAVLCSRHDWMPCETSKQLQQLFRSIPFHECFHCSLQSVGQVDCNGTRQNAERGGSAGRIWTV